MLLHKYVGLQGIDIIENKRLKADDPMAFNDPFELLITGLGNITPELIQLRLKQPEFLGQLYAEYKIIHPGIDEDEFKKRIENARSNDVLLEQFAPIITSGWNDELENQRQESYKSFRIICFSAPEIEAEKEILMWAYYADGHKGMRFHLESDYIEQASKVLRDVKYKEEPVSLDLKKHYLSNYSERGKRIGQAVNESTFTKSIGWSHENEYRILISPHECAKETDEHGGAMYFCEIDAQVIRGIDFGINCPQDIIDRVCALIESNNDLKNAQLTKASRNNKRFEMVYKARRAEYHGHARG